MAMHMEPISFAAVFNSFSPHVTSQFSPVICSFIGRSPGEEATGAAIRYQISRSLLHLMTMMTQMHTYTPTLTRGTLFSSRLSYCFRVIVAVI